jgi:hypothetical protein
MIPLILTMITFAKRSILQNDSLIKRRCLSFYLELSTRSNLQTLYSFIFYLRRIAFVGILLFTTEHKAFQILTMNVIAILIFMYISVVKPYQSPFMNRLELFNEAVTILILDFLFAFSDFAQTNKARTTNGWLIIGLFYFQTLVNLFLSFRQLTLFFKNRIIWRYYTSSKLRTVQI